MRENQLVLDRVRRNSLPALHRKSRRSRAVRHWLPKNPL
jgi:hypothetical protein